MTPLLAAWPHLHWGVALSAAVLGLFTGFFLAFFVFGCFYLERQARLHEAYLRDSEAIIAKQQQELARLQKYAPLPGREG